MELAHLHDERVFLQNTRLRLMKAALQKEKITAEQIPLAGVVKITRYFRCMAPDGADVSGS